jgi:2-polyprenyl-6-methoxyphenol hydroxylase-like FAD-dependent oxidoreductase
VPSLENARHDVVVVGARCAGAATALLLARMGHDVVLVDRARFPSDTLSTHGIARGGVVQLARWGLLDDVLASGAPAVRQVTFGRDLAATTLPIKERAGVGFLLAPRRRVLDQLLVDAAVAAGARLTTGVTVTGVRRDDGGRVGGVVGRHADGRAVELAARYVVGADGLRSRVARAVGATAQDSFRADTATFYTYVTGDWPAYEFHTAHNAFAGVFPTHDGQACVWLIRPVHAMRRLRTAGAGRGAALLCELDLAAPHLAHRVRDGRVTARVRGTVGLPNYVRVPVGPGWALAGDAGYHRDPITGHGITDAFRDAELLARALDRSLSAPAEEPDAMAAYHSRRDAALREVFDLTRSLARFPHPDRFVELQIQLSEALEREADDLASLPAVAGPAAGAAA